MVDWELEITQSTKAKTFIVVTAQYNLFKRKLGTLSSCVLDIMYVVWCERISLDF